MTRKQKWHCPMLSSLWFLYYHNSSSDAINGATYFNVLQDMEIHEIVEGPQPKHWSNIHTGKFLNLRQCWRAYLPTSGKHFSEMGPFAGMQKKATTPVSSYTFPECTVPLLMVCKGIGTECRCQMYLKTNSKQLLFCKLYNGFFGISFPEVHIRTHLRHHLM